MRVHLFQDNGTCDEVKHVIQQTTSAKLENTPEYVRYTHFVHISQTWHDVWLQENIQAHKWPEIASLFRA